VSARRRRGEDEFADERPWLDEGDDAGPWLPEAEDGWSDRPDPASGGGRRGRHSGAQDPQAAPGGWGEPTARLPRQAGPHGRPAAGSSPAWQEPGWDDPRQGSQGREDDYALRREPDPPRSRRAAPRDQDPLGGDPYPGSASRNGLPGDRYPGPAGGGPAGQDPGAEAAGRRSRRAAPPAQAGYPETSRPPARYPDTGDRYARPAGPGADPLQRPSGRGGDPAGRYGGQAGSGGFRSPAEARYRDPVGRYGDPDDPRRGAGAEYGGRDDAYGGAGAEYGGRDDAYGGAGAEYGGRDDAYGGAGAEYGGRDDAYGGAGAEYGGRDDPYGDRGGQYQDQDGWDREGADRPGGRGYGDPGERSGARGRYPDAGDGYPAPGRGGTGRYPDAGTRRAGPGADGYRDEYGERSARDDRGWDDEDDYQAEDAGWPFGGGTGGSGDGGGSSGGGRKRRKRRGRWAGPSSILIVAAIILIPLIAGGIYAYRVISAHYDPPNYSGSGTGTVIFQVKPGDTAETVGNRLVTDGVVASDRALVLAAEHSSNASALQPGYFRLHKHMNAQLAWNLLVSPSARVQLKVTIPEGWRVTQILAALGKQSGIPASDYRKAIKDTKALGLPSYAKGNPEGYLYPATYEIPPHSTATSVLKQMVAAFDQEATQINLPKEAARGNLTQAQAIVVASLAQAEGGKDSDFPKITRVIYNRLRDHMPLDLDSTVLYALHTYGILASTQQLKVKSPYNTYAHQGLPPAPIDCPGNAAIQAALHPAKGNWLYFVTVNPKTKQTDFTSSPAVFQQYKNQLQQYLSSHGG
jgi:UPF0755 protein